MISDRFSAVQALGFIGSYSARIGVGLEIRSLNMLLSLVRQLATLSLLSKDSGWQFFVATLDGGPGRQTE